MGVMLDAKGVRFLPVIKPPIRTPLTTSIQYPYRISSIQQVATGLKHGFRRGLKSRQEDDDALVLIGRLRPTVTQACAIGIAEGAPAPAARGLKTCLRQQRQRIVAHRFRL